MGIGGASERHLERCLDRERMDQMYLYDRLLHRRE
jgi:hypothetical protein